MNQTSENGKKTNFGSDFDPFGPSLGVQLFWWVLPLLAARHCSELSISSM